MRDLFSLVEIAQSVRAEAARTLVRIVSGSIGTNRRINVGFGEPDHIVAAREEIDRGRVDRLERDLGVQ